MFKTKFGLPRIEVDEQGRRKRPLKRELIKLAFVFLGFYIAVGCLIASPLYGAIALHPWQGPEEFYKIDHILGAKGTQCWFENGHGDKLHGWLFVQPKAT